MYILLSLAQTINIHMLYRNAQLFNEFLVHPCVTHFVTYFTNLMRILFIKRKQYTCAA